MKSLNAKLMVLGAAALLSSFATAEMMDRPGGIKIGQRMTLKPYVSVSASYDSNVSGSHSGGSGKTDDIMWTINPGLNLEYKAEDWALLLNAYYNYHAYCQKRNSSDYNQHSYGESLRWNWSNSTKGDKGWSLMLSETFTQITMADDLTTADGSNYTADRRQMSAQGSVQRRFNENWHSEASLSYYDLDYLNDGNGHSYDLYGWQRWSGGLSAGYAPSKWIDLMGVIGYQGYRQDNAVDSQNRNSQGYTAQVGFGSYATERITYRALAGWSRFEYSNNSNTSDGFTYSIAGNWKISDTWTMMLLATSYYQPSEYEQSSKSRTDSVSWGLGKSLVRDKLHAKLDVTYRHQTVEYVGNYAARSSDYALDTATVRLGLDYTLNRYLAAFVYGEYLRHWNDQSDDVGGWRDYDRWRVTAGLRLTY